MHQYRSAAVAQIDRQLLRIPANRPPESIVTYLRSLRTYLDAKGASRVLGCHRETLYLLIEEKKLPAQKRGRRWRIDPIAFANWLESSGLAQPTANDAPEKRQQEAPPNN
ncbi:MAG TPA: helix-turn-helix domain-containing protein [Terracidiphilus sp.]|nr:helix-turn-helix domain-containing protein [Terracidiphilus sp.]